MANGIQSHVATEPSPRPQEACTRLRVAGLRITCPRIAILKSLVNRDPPASLETIHADVGDACDLVTVYRSVGAMQRLGIVRRVFSASGVGLYALELEPERYYVTTRSGDSVALGREIPSPEMRLAVQGIEDSLRALGYTNVEHLIQFCAEAPQPEEMP